MSGPTARVVKWELVVAYMMSGGWLVAMVWKSEDWVVEVV